MQLFRVWTQDNKQSPWCTRTLGRKGRAKRSGGPGISLSSKIDVIRGVPLKMGSNTLGTAHSFDHHGQAYSWSVSNLSLAMNTLYFRNAGGNLLARRKKRPDGMMGGGSTPIFEVFVPPRTMDMDMIIVAGLAAAEYWDKYKQE
ncbi:hypothetical protein LX32DRAFT_727896 [Colletotrichum zoysiae]|uniref:Uncharacterized protein n=1 Tax=Colletotrichum zoysiae TaxID=1216348 RepID=A0AAD9M0M6_9PEZI|nr:hypothetical protein LX32DRAFT_727896 [Colletotrichum zoysiae]